MGGGASRKYSSTTATTAAPEQDLASSASVPCGWSPGGASKGQPVGSKGLTEVINFAGQTSDERSAATTPARMMDASCQTTADVTNSPTWASERGMPSRCQSKMALDIPSPKGHSSVKSKLQSDFRKRKNKHDSIGYLNGKVALSLVCSPHILYELWGGGAIEDSFTLGKIIGEGGFGSVLVAKGTDGSMRAVKTMVKSEDKDVREMQVNEVQTLVGLDHPHIVKLFMFYESDTQIKLVFELCKGPALSDKIYEGAMSERKAAVALRHMLKALKYCHDKYFGHYDCKPENFMYSGLTETNLKMIDFGFSGGFMQGGLVRGTISYMAPEIIHKTFGPEADVWSCGAVLFAMLTSGEFTDLDPEGDNNELMDILKVRFRDRRWSQWRLQVAGRQFNFSTHASDLMAKMLTHDRHMRPSVLEALGHPFIAATYFEPIHDDTIETQAKEVLNTLAQSLRRFSQHGMLQRSALLVLSHVVSCGDGLAKAQRVAYRKLDRGGAGELSVDALEMAMRVHNISVPTDLDDLFAYLDTDNDGYICFVDFLSATLPLSILREKIRIGNVFTVLDVNKDGRIDTSDLAHAFGYDVQNEAATKVCSDAIVEAGLAPTGFSCAEFVAFMQKDL